MKRPRLLQEQGNCEEATLRGECKRAKDLGFDGIELFAHGLSPDSWPGPWEAPIGAVAAQCTTFESGSAASEVVGWLEWASARRATCLNLTIPPVCPVGDRPAFTTNQDAMNFSYELLRAVRYETERTGVCLALEAASGGTFLSPVELRELIDDAHCWAVGACLDLDRIAKIGSPDDWLTTLGRRVHSVRALFAPENHAWTEDQITSQLDAIRFNGPLILRDRAETEEVKS